MIVGRSRCWRGGEGGGVVDVVLGLIFSKIRGEEVFGFGFLDCYYIVVVFILV